MHVRKIKKNQHIHCENTGKYCTQIKYGEKNIRIHACTKNKKIRKNNKNNNNKKKLKNVYIQEQHMKIQCLIKIRI